MRILIIGGSGFVGRDVAACLCRMGHEVILFNRGDMPFDRGACIAHVHGDLRDVETYGPRLRKLAPDVVLEDMFHFSANDARRVISTLTGTAGRIVAISGTDVYRIYGRLFMLEPGPVEPVPATEASPLRNTVFPGMGGYDKLEVEPAVMASPEMPGTILRLPPVYGPRSMMHRVHFYLKRMDDRRPFIILSRYLAAWQWTHGYVENMAHAVATACVDERACGRIYNLGETAPVSMIEWVGKIGRAAGWNGEILIAPHNRVAEISPFALMGINTAQDATVDSSLIRRELGCREIVTPEEALARTVSWERANPIPSQLMDGRFFDYPEEDRLAQDIRQADGRPPGENYH